MNPNAQMPIEQSLALLQSAEAGVLSTLNPDGAPYAVPVHLVVREGKVYVHCGHHGQKLENIKNDPRVCLTAWVMDGYTRPEDPSPCKTGTAYHSVMLRGRASVVGDAAQKRALLRLFAEKYTPEKDPDKMPEGAIARTCVLEISGEITGKQKPAEDGSPLPFRDIKAEMDTPAVRRIIAYAALDGSPEGTDREVRLYQHSPHLHFYGYLQNGEVLGICGFEEHAGKIEVHLISVEEGARRKGIGTAMVRALQRKYNKPVEAETVDEAVGFYRKIGFQTTSFPDPAFGRKWTCVL